MTNWVDDRASEMREIIAKIEELQKDLTTAQLHWRERDDEWSIAQIFEHLLLTDHPSIDPIAALLTNAPRGEKPWKPSLIGKLITKAVEPKTRRRTRAKKGFLPTTQPPSEVIKEYIAIRRRLLELLVKSAGSDLNQIKTTYPIQTPFRYNLGDAFMILIRHTQRHLQQIDRLRNRPDFPGNGVVRTRNSDAMRAS